MNSEAAADVVTVTSLPLPDPAGTRAAVRERRMAGWEVPVIRLALVDDPDVESVLHALECYAGDDDPRVRLAIRR